jgi:protein-disulfide isomerase
MFLIKFRAIAWTFTAKKALQLAVTLSLCVLMLAYSLPAQAASKINPQLEEQVLQIIRQHPEVVIESVQAYQQQQQQQVQQAQQAFVQDLKTNPQKIIGQSPTTGATEQKIVLIEFSDFQCPYCAEAHKTLKQFMAKHQDEVKLVYKHFPLIEVHAEALVAAKAAWAANQQGKFWQYEDELFSNQDKLNEGFYLDTAKKLDLDLEKFNSDRNAALLSIQQDMQLGQQLGLSGTPFFLMFATGNSEADGKAFSGAVQLSDLEKIFAQVNK